MCIIAWKIAHAVFITTCQEREKGAICFLVRLVTDTAEGYAMHQL